jgi:cell wall-associated NlpC family hydrolase
VTLLDTAQSLAGTPYSLGGPLGRTPDDHSSCDCSGFVSFVFASNGISGLTAFTDAMHDQTEAIDGSPSFGDLVFYGPYDDPSQPGVRFPHVGIYIGGGQTIDCKWPNGVSVHPILNLPYEVRRVPAFNPSNEAGDGSIVASGGPPWLLIGIGAAAFVLLFGRRNPSQPMKGAHL